MDGKKYLIVALDVTGGGGDLWREDYEKIAEQRIKHFATKNDYQPDQPEYKTLVRISNKEEEVIEWSRRFVAPKKLRDSWFHCTIECEENGKKTLLNPKPSKPETPMTLPDRIAALEENNRRLSAALEDRGGVAVAVAPDPRIATLETEIAELRKELRKKGGGA